MILECAVVMGRAGGPSQSVKWFLCSLCVSATVGSTRVNDTPFSFIVHEVGRFGFNLGQHTDTFTGTQRDACTKRSMYTFTVLITVFLNTQPVKNRKAEAHAGLLCLFLGFHHLTTSADLCLFLVVSLKEHGRICSVTQHPVCVWISLCINSYQSGIVK